MSGRDACDVLTLSDDLLTYSEEFLLLGGEASRPYDEFVYGDRRDAMAICKRLFLAGQAEFCPPAGKVALDGNRCVGMIAFLSGAMLRRRRLATALTVTRMGATHVALEPLKHRLALAAQTLFRPEDTDSFLSRLAVAPSSRGAGIGGFLMRHFLEESERLGCPRCVLEVEASSTTAISLYRRFGFGEIDRRRAVDADRHVTLEYVHMAKTLRSAGGGRPLVS